MVCRFRHERCRADPRDRPMMLAAGGEIAPDPAQQRMVPVVGHVLRLQPGRVMHADHAAAAAHEAGEVGLHLGGIVQGLPRKQVADEDDRRRAIEDVLLLRPLVDDLGGDRRYALSVLQHVFHHSTAGGHFVRSRRMLRRADDDEHLLRVPLIRNRLAAASCLVYRRRDRRSRLEELAAILTGSGTSWTSLLMVGIHGTAPC